MTDDTAFVEVFGKRPRHARLTVTEVAEITPVIGGLFLVGGESSDFVPPMATRAEIQPPGERDPLLFGCEGEAPQEAVSRVGKVHIVTGYAGEFVESLNECFEGEDPLGHYDLIEPVDGKVHRVKRMLALSVTFLAQE